LTTFLSTIKTQEIQFIKNDLFQDEQCRSFSVFDYCDEDFDDISMALSLAAIATSLYSCGGSKH